MKTLKIDDKWSVKYDPANNDSPDLVMRYGEPCGTTLDWDSADHAMFRALLKERERSETFRKMANGQYGKLGSFNPDNPSFVIRTPNDFAHVARTLIEHPQFIAQFLTALAEKIHADNVAAGWWADMESGESVLHTRNVPEMLCLIHSEISEAMEGYRKKLMDDKLPHRPALQTELVDALIRILDLAGSRMAIEEQDGVELHPFGVELHPFGDIFEEKRAFNRERADHKLENRRKAGGKAF